MIKPSIYILIFRGHIILRHLVGVDFSLLIVFCMFDPVHDAGLKSVSFLDQLVNAFGVGDLNIRQSLQVS